MNNKSRKSPQKKSSSSSTPPSSASPPAVPLFYTSVYADPPDCADLPLPPASWYLPASSCSRATRKRNPHQSMKTVRFVTGKA